jgi:predicted aldo/keto reductase-like oxidoreductase
MINTKTPCQYIGGHGHTPTCTHTALAGHSYCAEHLALVYKAGTARAVRHKEKRIVDKVRLVESLFNEAIEQLEAEGFDCYGDSELKTNRFESDEDQEVVRVD